MCGERSINNQLGSINFEVNCPSREARPRMEQNYVKWMARRSCAERAKRGRSQCSIAPSTRDGIDELIDANKEAS